MTKNHINKSKIRQLANCIRFLSIDAVQKAKSGHPGMPMGMADIATVLYKDHLKFDPFDASWIDRDRLIISNGHGSMLLYSALYLTGYQDVSLSNLKNFRQIGSPTAGHPEYGELSGIETTTGPLSQGLANGVGMALAEKILSSKFSKKIFDHHTYVFAGDGCLMEGLSHEACSLAGHLGLSKLIVFFDNNSISIDGETKLSVSEDTIKRFESYGWKTISIDGHNHKSISAAIIKAKKNNAPTLISCKTKIGFGSPNKESKSSSHGSPLGEEEINLTRRKLKWKYKEFEIPKELLKIWRQFYQRNKKIKKNWTISFNKIKKNKDFQDYYSNKFSKKLDNDIKNFKKKHIQEKTNCATRKASELSLEILSKEIKNLIGGSADLTGSNNTKTQNMNSIKRNDFTGSYIYYGVREHGMAGIMNGLALHGGIKPYGGTFLVFTDYCRPSIRLAALMNLPVIYVMTHDSIGLGEDGPTHQPVEHIASLRAIPNLTIIRPADVIETIEAWEYALKSQKPTVLILTRQNLPIQRFNNKINIVKNGAYPIIDYKKFKATIVATGSELEIAVLASKKLYEKKINVRVVSFPSWEIFEHQAENKKKNILGNKPIYAIEAGVVNGWEKYTPSKNFVGMKTFGASGPYKKLYRHFNITANHLVKLIKKGVK
ncbi:transketolase [Alphaproteobacteria bacterium]|nr:transketolase [Alphaproteobacteria bacterium]